MAPPRLGEKAFPSESTYSTEGKTNPSRNLGLQPGGRLGDVLLPPHRQDSVL